MLQIADIDLAFPSTQRDETQSIEEHFSHFLSKRGKDFSPTSETAAVFRRFAKHPELFKQFCIGLIGCSNYEEQDCASAFVTHLISSLEPADHKEFISLRMAEIFKTMNAFRRVVLKESEQSRLALREPLVTFTDGELAACRYDTFKLILSKSTKPAHDIANLNTGHLGHLKDPNELERYYSLGHHYLHFQYGRTAKGHLEESPGHTALNIYEAFSKFAITPPLEVQDEFVSAILLLDPTTADSLTVELQCVSELSFHEQFNQIRSLLEPFSQSLIQRLYMKSIDCSYMVDDMRIDKEGTHTNPKVFYISPIIIHS